MNSLEVYPMASRPEWKKSNAIVLLGGGFSHWPEAKTFKTSPLALSRVFETARLYLLCIRQADRYCKIITSAGDVNGMGISEAKVMQNELMVFGIPEKDIILEEKSRNTFENAMFSAPLIKSHGFEHVLVVTSGFHMYRSMILFNHAKLNVIPAPADKTDLSFSILPKAGNIYWTEIALHEFGGRLKFYVFNTLGWDY